jgi:hypothetical protein
VLTSADVEPSKHENNATVTGTPASGQGAPIAHTSNTVVVTVPAEPAFTIEKQHEIKGSGAGFTTKELTGKVGQTVSYQIVVKDTGNTSLTFGKFEDANCEGIMGGPSKALEPGESTTYTCSHVLTKADVEPSKHENTATVTATPPSGQGPPVTHTSNTVVENVPAEPAYTIEKQQEIKGSGAGFTTKELTGKVGQTVSYQIVVKDTGNTSLTLAEFKDAKCEGIAGGPSKALEPGESATYTCSHTLTTADLEAGKRENNATVTGTPPKGQGPPTTHTSNTVVVEVVPPGCPANPPKVNVRWHYNAEGSSGSWSNTQEAPCGKTLTMGPQAMEGNLKVTPGKKIKAGYDFTLPGNNKPFMVMFSEAKVVFKVRCVSGKPPSEPTFTVALPKQFYSVNTSNWYPTGDQSSPLSYQGEREVPNLCAGGQLNLGEGGTFSALVTLF